MTKFNVKTTKPAVRSPIVGEQTPTGQTYEGAPGYARDTKSELFLLAVANMVGENTFYEQAHQRDNRYGQLIHKVAVSDPVWLGQFLGWLRSEANMRSASLVGALEAAHAMLTAEKPGARQIVASVLQRADEPGEALAYWTSHYGRAIPKPVKRGVADAAARLYTERSLLKYDTGSHGWRFGDVLELTHASPAADKPWQGDLFKVALDRRHNRSDAVISGRLRMLVANMQLRLAATTDPQVLLDSSRLREAGMTWEDALSLAGAKVDKAKLWEALTPSMGYMALLRNLRNFDDADVPDEVAEKVAARLADPEQVAGSRQFPFRFLSAYRVAPSLRWSYPLEKALNLSLANVPALPGRTLVLVDRSPSMWWNRFSERSTVPWADAAAIFGTAVALRAEHADLVEFGIENGPVRFRRGESVLKILERFRQLNGTDIPAAVRDHLHGHNRIVIVTDEQTRPGWLPSNGYQYGGMPETLIDDLVPQNTPLYMWNFGGYTHGFTPSGVGQRHTFGGLSDAAFRTIPLLETGRDAGWPWETTTDA